jgi:O-succinylbenzoate synthase
MKVERVELHLIDMPLAHAFETSFGREETRPCILVAVYAGGLAGWGECTAHSGPWYSSETVETAWHVLRDFLIPELLEQEISSPADVPARFKRVRGHAMARAALENAVWDLLAQSQGLSLAEMLGAPRQRVPVGVSVGIEPTLEALLDRVAGHLADGYGRIKLKIKPGWDVEVVRAVRQRWPDVPLQVDANSAYSLHDAPILVDHAQLQKQLRTPLCLDESIHSPEHARWALDIGACRIINIKVGRVGGLTAARKIHDLCAERGVPVWCGGMLETNVGRAANVALATLPNFSLPGDISASARYYRQDIAEPNFVLNEDSTLSVPIAPGLGVQVVPQRVSTFRLRHLALPG